VTPCARVRRSPTGAKTTCRVRLFNEGSEGWRDCLAREEPEVDSRLAWITEGLIRYVRMD